ncbi:peptidoglycan DD-metalloendopeptidase family protein [Oleiagrimonas sp. C23AA]|uniref:OapA family protein n=1 Tax=Oleiagrimonas sp. C23AA TaxID=2719047 RepID=UPI00141F4B04|nr:peptidoglycan DD-metalloendopeptidase family protein [Oleiagrimonas sp. C23AA]NII10584.1 peptidoglycan DD-metalloendopeptidase family protein [Oleiagrimonas sp. C23AA]
MGQQHSGRLAHSARREAIRRKAQRRHENFYKRCAHWSLGQGDTATSLNWKREHWILAGTALLVVLLSAVVIPAWANAMTPPPAPTVHQVTALPLPKLPESAKQAPLPAQWHTVHVQPGQTLSDIFQSQGLNFSDLQQVLSSAKDAQVLRNIHPGDEFSFLIGPGGAFKGIRFDQDDTHRVVMRVNGDAMTHKVVARELERREHMASGVITSSLFGAGAKAGLSEAMIVELADVFKYDVDFIKDIRKGDRFTVIYDDVYRDGAYLHHGDIIAAEFYNRGQRYTAYRFKKPDGSYAYYDESGRPLQRGLLRTPVKFSRISSRFSLARKHPVLGYTRAHKGVDYAAPTGTPIHAAGNGTITYRGWARGFGNFIKIKHNAEYTTAYGHMSRFAKGLHVGSHVTQGEVIGFVGMTGLATGPHLHYEVRVYGKQRNPLTVTMPKPKPLAPKLLATFKQRIKPMVARIDAMDHDMRLAMNTPGKNGASAGMQ